MSWPLRVIVLLAGLMVAFASFAQGLGSKALREAIERYEEAQKQDAQGQKPRDDGSKDEPAKGPVGKDGLRTTIERNPWQAALVFAKDADRLRGFFCGGVIVHPNWVLTSAACVDNETQPELVGVLSGTALLFGNAGTFSEVERITIHPQWNSVTHDSDLAVVRVKTPLAGRPILPGDAALVEKGGKVWVSGWGITIDQRPRISRGLKGIELEVIDAAECNRPRSYGGKVTLNMFCAGQGGGRAGPDTCEGDAGAPVTVGTGNDARLVGIGSWGDGCSVPYKYGIYTRVANFVAWVRQATNGEANW